MADATYEADLAYYHEQCRLRGGYVYESGTGHILWSAEAMTDLELTEHWAYIDANSAFFAAQDDIEYDPEYTLGAYRNNWSYYAT